MGSFYDDETIEDLQLNGLRLIQKKTGFRLGMDSVLLADFARIRQTDVVADLGTGNGALLLLLHGRGKGARYLGVEIQQEAAELAGRNMALNHLEDRAEIIRMDVREIPGCLGPCTVDAVVCNPPYGSPSSTLKSPYAARSIARNQEADTLDQFFRSARWILKGKGKISLVYPAPPMMTLLNGLHDNGLEPKRMRLVYPVAGKEANLILVEAVKDAKPAILHLPPLIIRHEDGSMTEELKRIYSL